MSTQQIRAPSDASRLVVARPMPDAAPVTSAAFPSSWPIGSPGVDVAAGYAPNLLGTLDHISCGRTCREAGRGGQSWMTTSRSSVISRTE